MGRFFRGQMVARNSLLVTRVSHPRRAKHAPPPAQVPPTQTLFARGPVAVGIGVFPVAEEVPLHWRGGTTPGPARRVAWVVSAGVVRECGIGYLVSCHPVA